MVPGVVLALLFLDVETVVVLPRKRCIIESNRYPIYSEFLLMFCSIKIVSYYLC